MALPAFATEDLSTFYEWDEMPSRESTDPRGVLDLVREELSGVTPDGKILWSWSLGSHRAGVFRFDGISTSFKDELKTVLSLGRCLYLRDRDNTDDIIPVNVMLNGGIRTAKGLHFLEISIEEIQL